MSKDQQLKLLILVEGGNEDIGRKATEKKICVEEGGIFHLSNGETSKVEEDLYISSKFYYKPIIECCDGIGLSSSYILGSQLQPQVYVSKQ